MNAEVIVLIITVLASMAVGFLLLRKSAKSEAWLERIEDERVNSKLGRHRDS